AAIELKIDGARRERPREERDQTTHRPVAVQTGRAAFDDLDVIEHRLGYATPIDPLTPRVVDRHAVEEHRGAALVDAANRDDLRRSANQAALPRQLDGRQLAQEILRFTRGTLLHLLGRQHVDRRGDLRCLDRRARGGDNDARQHQRALLECDVERRAVWRRDGDGSAVGRASDRGNEHFVRARGNVSQQIDARRIGDRDALRHLDLYPRAGDRCMRRRARDRPVNTAGLLRDCRWSGGDQKERAKSIHRVHENGRVEKRSGAGDFDNQYTVVTARPLLTDEPLSPLQVGPPTYG